MALDAFETIYIWVGLKSNKIERRNAQKKVAAYATHVCDGRDFSKIQYVEIDPCGEPFVFKNFFPEWEDEIADGWLEDDPYTKKMKEL